LGGAFHGETWHLSFILSSSFVFALRDSDLSSLVIFDRVSRDKHAVFSGSGPGVPAATAPTSLATAWSPSGDRLAVTADVQASNYS